MKPVKRKGSCSKSVDTGDSVKMPSRSASSSSQSSTSGSPVSDCSSLARQQRNLAEKQRRDKLNSFINELATLVPLASGTPKRLDKTSILRLSAAHLRLHQSPLNPKNFKKRFSWRPDILDTVWFSELLKAINGFLIIASLNGKIIVTSKAVENYLGHQDIEMIGHSLFFFVHPADLDRVKEELREFIAQSLESKRTSLYRTSFCARMRQKSQPRSEVVVYQVMHFNCCLSLNEEVKTPSQKGQKRSSDKEDLGVGLLEMFLKPVNINPQNDLTLMDAFQEEYITKHGIDGKILFADHRISTITGHLPHEVLGMLAYDYIFPEDVPVAHFAQKLMFSSSNGVGMIVYRLRARNATPVYLKTIGHLQYDETTTKVDHFICFNKLLGEEEGEKELRKFTDRFSPHVKEILTSFSRHKMSLTYATGHQINDATFELKSNGSPNSSLTSSSPCEDITFSDSDMFLNKSSSQICLEYPSSSITDFPEMSSSSMLPHNGITSVKEHNSSVHLSNSQVLTSESIAIPNAKSERYWTSELEIHKSCANSPDELDATRSLASHQNFKCEMQMIRRKRNSSTMTVSTNESYSEWQSASKNPRYNNVNSELLPIVDFPESEHNPKLLESSEFKFASEDGVYNGKFHKVKTQNGYWNAQKFTKKQNGTARTVNSHCLPQYGYNFINQELQETCDTQNSNVNINIFDQAVISNGAVTGHIRHSTVAKQDQM